MSVASLVAQMVKRPSAMCECILFSLSLHYDYIMFPRTSHTDNSVVESFPAPVLPSISKGEITSTMHLCDPLLGNEIASAY